MFATDHNHRFIFYQPCLRGAVHLGVYKDAILIRSFVYYIVHTVLSFTFEILFFSICIGLYCNCFSVLQSMACSSIIFAVLYSLPYHWRFYVEGDKMTRSRLCDMKTLFYRCNSSKSISLITILSHPSLQFDL